MFWAELGAVGCRVISELRVEGFGDFWLSSVDDSFASWLKLRKLNDINGEASVVVVEVEPSSGSNVCGHGCSDEKKVLVGSGVKVLKNCRVLRAKSGPTVVLVARWNIRAR